MIVYLYDDSGEYIGESIAMIDPEETKLKGCDVWMMPPNSTSYAPPVQKEGYARVWNGSDWEYAEDHRKQTGWVDGKPVTIDALGPLPAGWSSSSPNAEEATGDTKTQHRLEILSELSFIDSKKMRSVSGIVLALADGREPDAEDVHILQQYEVQAQKLRDDLTSFS